MRGRNKKTMSLIGQRFGLLVVTGLGSPRFVTVRCDCGKEKEATPKALRRGGVKSCGCQQYVGLNQTTHGQSSTATYNTWLRMIARCGNPQHPKYKYYGGRGIQVCERWLSSFENFLADMGHKPTGKTLDRYPDNNGNYEPENCRWATMREQSNNRRSNVLVTAHGQTLTVAQWAEISGKRPATIHDRLRSGLAGESAVGSGYTRRPQVA